MRLPDEPRPASPKLIQKESPDEAAHLYAHRYREALSEGDRFLSEMYMDELLSSIILTDRRNQPSRGLPAPALDEKVRQVVGRLPEEQARCMEEDLDIGLSKRYPEQYRVDEDH